MKISVESISDYRRGLSGLLGRPESGSRAGSDRGSDRDGSDRDGSDRDGSDRDGSDRDGSDRDGSDRLGSEREGSTSSIVTAPNVALPTAMEVARSYQAARVLKALHYVVHHAALRSVRVFHCVEAVLHCAVAVHCVVVGVRSVEAFQFAQAECFAGVVHK